jgi:anti-anti-sigma factor
MHERSGLSSVRSVTQTHVAPDEGPVADRMPVAATVTDPAGVPILTVTLELISGVATVIADGDVDVDTAPLLRAAVIAAVDRHPRVCCDLRGVTFFGAAGSSALAAGHRRAAEAGARLEVRGAHGTTRRVLELTGLDILLTGHR